MMRAYSVLLPVVVAVALAILLISTHEQSFAAKGGLSGTTLTVTKTVDETEFVREFNWTIEKSVTPETIDMFTGDSSAASYTINATRTVTDTFVVSGEICVKNGGSFTTAGLTIVDQVQYKTGTSKYQNVPGASQTITPPQLAPAETECYPYSIEFTPISDAKYRNSVKVTITNHAGKVGTAYGPEVKADATFPSTPTTIVGFDTIEIQDTNGGQFFFSDTGSQSYESTFDCDDDEGTNDNTATIVETGQSDDASVTVNCYSLEVSKDAETSFTREYNWHIAKLADISSISGPQGFEHTINYRVVLNLLAPVDSDFEVQGNITVHNPAPIDANVTSVSDIVSPSTIANVDCGVTFPYTLSAGGSLNCTYSATLPNSSSRTNTATATLQNHDYDSDGVGTASGTTDFTGTANVDFTGSTPSDGIDECVDVSDTLQGFLGQVCADQAPYTFNYEYEVTDSVDTDVVGSYTIDNTADFTTNDTGTTGSDDNTVFVLVFED
jgi:hypothetical protein